jgi:hypothetical protein
MIGIAGGQMRGREKEQLLGVIEKARRVLNDELAHLSDQSADKDAEIKQKIDVHSAMPASGTIVSCGAVGVFSCLSVFVSAP